MPTDTALRQFGPTHLAALAATVLGLALLIHAARRHSPFLRHWERALGVLLLFLHPVEIIIAAVLGRLDRENSLPLHLCSIAGILGGLALLTKRQPLIDLTYFWGMAGTLQGLLTPTLAFDFPDIAYFRFFALHSGVVIAAVYLTFGLRLYPPASAKWRALLLINAYLAVAAVVNLLIGSNYGYTQRKPDAASLMDFLGPWPWYLVSMEALALVLFLLLDLPFRRLRGQKPPAAVVS